MGHNFSQLISVDHSRTEDSDLVGTSWISFVLNLAQELIILVSEPFFLLTQEFELFPDALELKMPRLLCAISGRDKRGKSVFL